MKEVQKKFSTKKLSPKEEERIALKEKRRTSEKGEKKYLQKENRLKGQNSQSGKIERSALEKEKRRVL